MEQGKLQYRQGDVLLIEVSCFPKEAKKHATPQTTIAIGEVQGHSHRLEGGKIATYDLPDGRLAVEVLEAVSLVHGVPGVDTPDAHETQTIKPGKYVRILQHEWDPLWDTVPVVD